MRKIWLKRSVIMLLLLPLLATQTLAAGIVLKIAENGLQGWTGTLNPDYTGGNADAANIEFFKGSIPGPLETGGRFAPAYTWLPGAKTHQYDDTGVNGGSVYIRSWDGPARTQGSYYGKSAPYAAASGAQPALQYPVAPFKTDFLADKPKNAPIINAVAEANKRIGETPNVVLNLAVDYSYSLGMPKIEVTGYDLKYWIAPETEPADNDANRVVSLGGTTFNLPANDPVTNAPFNSGTYYFKVRAKNWFGAGPWSVTKEWKTLSGAAGGPSTKTYDFNVVSALGVNTFAVPFTTIATPDVTTVRKFVRQLNNTAGGNVVALCGYWDNTAKALKGGPVTYKSATLNAFDAETATMLGGLGNIVADRAYQISVTRDVSLSITGTR
ncbi:MAG: hypothetical protein WC529_07475 [Candidatus Margulisiibacteriota bacterium]